MNSPNNNNLETPSQQLWQATKEWFKALFNLETGSDREGTIIDIKNNKKMSGANAWMLICSIMIASLGLDLNSPAVIIGAMLISPLMSPILGIGLGVAINDRNTLFIALRNFLISILIALITSTLYFYITPFGDITDEIRARTAPTLLDGLVAIFGGFAGIISTTRKDKSNAIPGVAIATALMPPLCVTGFGIANWNTLGSGVGAGIAQNSFYLFFLNSFFIAATAYFIIKLLKFPLKTFVNKAEARRNRFILFIFSLLLIVPSVQILLNIYTEKQAQKKVENFIDQYLDSDQRQSSIYEIRKNGEKRVFFLELMGNPLPEDSIQYFQALLQDDFRMDSVRLEFLQSSAINQDEFDKMELRFKSIEQVQKQITESNKIRSEQARQIDQLQNQIDSIKAYTSVSPRTVKIAQAAFPDLKSLYFANAQTPINDTAMFTIPTFILSWQPGKSTSRRRYDQRKLVEVLKIAEELDTVKLVVE